MVYVCVFPSKHLMQNISIFPDDVSDRNWHTLYLIQSFDQWITVYHFDFNPDDYHILAELQKRFGYSGFEQETAEVTVYRFDHEPYVMGLRNIHIPQKH